MHQVQSMKSYRYSFPSVVSIVLLSYLIVYPQQDSLLTYCVFTSLQRGFGAWLADATSIIKRQYTVYLPMMKNNNC